MRKITQKEEELIEILADYFNVSLEDTPQETLESWQFNAWCRMRGDAFLSLEQVVKCLRINWWLDDEE